ncbi:MAG TPA: amidohydrolase family protein [Xanthobacteraceae bacterium]|jgi:5-methylthioadenosine/S-adenosylhomocysteine deaminase
MTARSCLFRDVLVVPPGGTTPFEGWVAVENTTIAAAGRGVPEVRAGQRVIHGNGAALLPGFVNTHAHSHSSLTRGSAEGLPLERWLALIESEQARLTGEQAYIAALATYAEALLSGTTTIVDMCLRPEPAMAAAREIGIRAAIVPYVADTKPFTPSLRDNARLLETAARDDRVQLWVGAHDLESCSDDCIRAAGELARRHHTGLHLHCSETRTSVDRTVSRVGRTPVAQLHTLAALSERTLLAHCVWLSEEDRALIAATGAHVAHCPHANLKLGSGIAPVPDLCRRGVNVTLATDGAKANNRLDMFDVMKFASLLHKGVTGDPTVLASSRVLEMATAGGAAALGISAGAIAPGCKADLLLVDLDGLHVQPCVPDTLLTNLVHAARGSDVKLVMVDGSIVVEDGHLADGRWSDLLQRVRPVGRELLG